MSLSVLCLTILLVSLAAPVCVKADDGVWKFDGSPWMLNAWIEAVEAWFVKEDITTEAKYIVLWKIFVTPDVLLWYLEQAAEASWDGIKGLLRGQYLNEGVQARAFEQLMGIRQTGSIEAYNVYFTRLVQSLYTERVTPTLLVNRYISGLNRTLAKGVLARNPGTWKQAQLYALELAGTPAYTKSETSGGAPDYASKKTPKKTAMTTITAQTAVSDSIPLRLNSEGLDDVSLSAFVDTMSTFTLISPSVIAWADLVVEHSDVPFHVCYTAESRPIAFHDRVNLSLLLRYKGCEITTEQVPCYVMRIPYVHFIIGKDLQKLLAKVDDYVEASMEEEEEGKVGAPKDPEILEVPRDTVTDDHSLVSDPHAERDATPMRSPRAESILGEVTPPITAAQFMQDDKYQADQRVALLGDEQRWRLRVIRAVVAPGGRMPHPYRAMKVKAVHSVLCIEAKELGWYAPDKHKPPPVFYPEEQVYKGPG
jgi:hypothetical protein